MRGAPTLLRYLSRVPSFNNRTATATLPSGESLSFPAYDHYWCRYLYAGRVYEPDVERIFRRLGKGRVLIDCGANIGYWSVRHREFGFTQSIAIEANPRLIPFLERNYAGPVHHAAVHSRSGETLLLGGDGAVGRVGPAGVPVQTLALADLGIDGAALVKLDVEGSEIRAIEGLGEMRAILVYEDFPRQGMKVTRHLLDRGWKIFNDRMEAIESVEAVSADLGKGIPRNLIAARGEDADRCAATLRAD